MNPHLQPYPPVTLSEVEGSLANKPHQINITIVIS